VPGLDGDKPAETAAEHEHRPEPQHAASGIERDANPSNGVAVNSPELDAIGVGWQIGAQQSDQTERRQHPAVRAILALAAAQIALGEGGRGNHQDGDDRERNERRMGEERRPSAPSKDSQAEIGQGRR
jgi:hypothetical protein